MQAGFRLEPLAGEAGVDGGAGDDVDAAEGELSRGPDRGAGEGGGEGRPPDMVSANQVDDPALDHRDGIPAHPHILADQGAVVWLYSAIRRPSESKTEWIVRPEGTSVRTACRPIAS